MKDQEVTTTLLPRISTIKVNEIDLSDIPDFIEDETGRILMSGMYASKYVPRTEPYRGIPDFLRSLIEQIPVNMGYPASWLGAHAPIITGKNSINQTKRHRFMDVIAFDALLEAYPDKFIQGCREEFLSQFRHQERVRDERNAPPEEPADSPMPPANPSREFLLALVQVDGDNIVATSREVAERYGKRHDNVVRIIETIIEDSSEVRSPNNPLFYKSFYKNSQNKAQPLYKITLDGMVMLNGRMNGPGPAAWLLLFIKAFNMMVEELRNQQHKPNFGGYEIPETKAAALRLAADLSEQNEEYKKIIEGQKPEVEAFRRLKGSPGALPFRESAWCLGLKETVFRDYLINVWKMCYKRKGSGATTPWAEFKLRRNSDDPGKKPYFDMAIVEYIKDGAVETHDMMTVTKQGLAEMARLLGVSLRPIPDNWKAVDNNKKD
jgi:Rha family phage regulatory protein